MHRLTITTNANYPLTPTTTRIAITTGTLTIHPVTPPHQ